MFIQIKSRSLTRKWGIQEAFKSIQSNYLKKINLSNIKYSDDNDKTLQFTGNFQSGNKKI